jgi:hypothetical protein
VCPPPDTGVHSIIYRLHDFMGYGTTVLGVGAVDVVTVGLLVGCVAAAATPSRLRVLHKCCIVATLAIVLPFAGSLVTIARRVFLELTRSGWRLQQFDAALAREVVCSLIIFLLGVAVAAAPAIAAALCRRRLSLATEERDLEARQLRKAAAVAGTLVSVGSPG